MEEPRSVWPWHMERLVNTVGLEVETRRHRTNTPSIWNNSPRGYQARYEVPGHAFRLTVQCPTYVGTCMLTSQLRAQGPPLHIGLLLRLLD
jgi:hypothetical protein